MIHVSAEFAGIKSCLKVPRDAHVEYSTDSTGGKEAHWNYFATMYRNLCPKQLPRRKQVAAHIDRF